MTYAIVVDDQEFPGPTITGWKELRQWAEKLKGDYPELEEFFEQNATGDVSRFLEELGNALADEPPTSDDVIDSILLLRKMVPEDADQMYVTDGLTDEDVEDDWAVLEDE